MKPARLKLVDRTDMRPVTSTGRSANKTYRTREHLTEAEMTKLLTALKANRHGHRDWLIGLLIYRHGLRVSEACDLRWDDLDLSKRAIAVRRVKGSTDSVHYLVRDELAGLKRLQREGPKAAYVFVNERGQPFGRMGIGRMIERAGEAAEAALPCARPHAPPFNRLRSSSEGHGYPPLAALPRPCLDHQHGEVHSHEL